MFSFSFGCLWGITEWR